MFKSHSRRVFDTLHQIAVRLSKHFLPPLRLSPLSSRLAQTNAVLQTTRQRRRRERELGTRASESDDSEADKLEMSIAKRRWIYRPDLYAKVCFLCSSLFSFVQFHMFLKHCLHEISPISYNCPIRCISRSYITCDDIFTKRTTKLGRFGCRGITFTYTLVGFLVYFS